jgi:DNA-binding MarR family transcriptional regulator
MASMATSPQHPHAPIGAKPDAPPADKPDAPFADKPDPSDHHDDALERLGAAFKAALVAARRLRGRETHSHGPLSNAQYGLLLFLCGGRRLSARELASAADLTPATVTQMLEALEQAGLVYRERRDDDRRVVLNSLTPQGRRLVESYRARVEPRWRAAMSEFSDEQLRSATAVLERLAQLLEDWDTPSR